MDFKFWDKYSYFSTPEEEQKLDYYEVKTKFQQHLEIATKIALKSVGTEEADVMHAEETFDGNLWGLEGSDELYGDDRNNVIYGGSEQDGRDGEYAHLNRSEHLDNDTIRGGDGNDRLYGQAGRDRLFTGNGDDYLYGGIDNDALIGNGAGKNIYNGGVGVDAVIMQHYDSQNPDEVWGFMDVGDRVFLQGDMRDLTGGIARVETTLWDGNAQLPHREARTQGDFYQSTEVKNADGHTLFFIEGPTENGITIGWNAGGMEVIGNDGDWNGAKFVHTERLTGIQEWGDQHWRI